MNGSFNRKGPDGPQKAFQYLILLAWFLLCWLALNIPELSSSHALASTLLLLLYNLLLAAICLRRARRLDDGHLIYPVVGSSIGSFVLLAWYFFR